jgi:predicted dehydrogenase
VAGETRGAAQASAADPAALDVASHAAQIADLLDAINTGREPTVTGKDGRATLEIVCAVYESSRTGRPVKIGMLRSLRERACE